MNYYGIKQINSPIYCNRTLQLDCVISIKREKLQIDENDFIFMNIL